MKSSALLVVKIGGKSAEDDALVMALTGELKKLQAQGCRILMVHGGGITISEIQKKYGITPRFIDGLRQTEPAEMPLVDMALAGAVNKRLVRILKQGGLNSWGLCGADAGILLAESISDSAAENRTGRVTSVDIRPLKLLWSGGYVPVLAPPATNSLGLGMNINADEAALALSTALKADQLVFISDVPGVLETQKVIRHLTPETAEEKISSAVITGGMIPKVKSAVEALKRGVGGVFIGEYTETGNLGKILSGLQGTLIDSGGNK
ncbi:MAG: acetylglutamate kinase [Spirochaetes bacterium]|nr:MAG: acetylglutamate kinase [Spirochaetota bacterium]